MKSIIMRALREVSLTYERHQIRKSKTKINSRMLYQTSSFIHLFPNYPAYKCFVSIIHAKRACKITTKCFLTHRLQKFLPIPGIEPGPPGWEPGILTTRQYGIEIHTFLYLFSECLSVGWNNVCPKSTWFKYLHKPTWKIQSWSTENIIYT